MIRLLSVLLAAFLAAPWPAGAQAPADKPGDQGPRQFLWEVSSLTNRVYLYGTVHAGKASFYPLPEKVQKAFADSKVLAVEADITNTEEMAKGASALVLKPPQTLDKILPAPLYERFRQQLARFGVPEEDMRIVRPFPAASLLIFNEWARLGYLPQYGVDLHLIKLAREAGKKLVELEGARAQTELMNAITPEQGVRALEGTLTALESGLTREQITGLVNAWQSGDADLLLDVARAYNETIPGAQELEELFIWSRHDAMAGKIEEWLLDGKDRVFIAVGALHLAGPRGLVQMLAKRGYTVRQP